jgi:hypothetical protein
MTKKIDLAEVEAALKRAARAAVSGDREARSGRFIPRDAPGGKDKEPVGTGKAKAAKLAKS